LSTGTYYASQTSTGCESATRFEVEVTVVDFSIDLDVTIVPYCGDSNGALSVTTIGGVSPFNYTWSTGAFSSTIDNCSIGFYSVEVVDSEGCISFETIDLNCILDEIPEIITPDGNGKNDTWVIGFVEFYPEVSVSIFNRWGNQVYFSSPYTDDWDGKANMGSIMGDEYLPGGTYYYIIGKKNGEKPLTGFIELVK
jgi:gliding motility-associated-like protein